MIMTVFNENFQRIDVVKKYTFAQYVDPFVDVGTFKIMLELNEENVYFLDKTKTYYIAFGSKIMGVVEKAIKDSDSQYEKTITVTGRLVSMILTKRVVVGQQKYTGTIPEIVKSFVETNLRDTGENSNRFINVNVSYDKTMVNEPKTVTTQKTGGTVLDAIVPVLKQESMGFDLYPVIQDVHRVPWMDAETNISVWKFDIVIGKNRTRGNTEGNEPVIFSHSFSNLFRSKYSFDSSDNATYAYIAGEGEGDNRIWAEFEREGTKNNKGWNRSEIYIDARDLRKTQTGGETITDEEYMEELKQRVNESYTEHMIFESYDGTINTNEKRYVYGEHFYKGDFVTVVDNELGLSVDIQITEVTRSIQGSQEITDISFGVKKIQVNERLKRKGVI